MEDKELLARIQQAGMNLTDKEAEKVLAYIRFAGVYIVIPTEKELIEYITEVIQGVSNESAYTKIHYNGVNYIILSELDLSNLDTFIENSIIFYNKGYKEEVNKKEYYVYRIN